MLLCKTGSQLALCHCSYSYADLLFIRVCSEPALMHCSTAQSKVELPSVQCCSAKQAHSLHFVTVVTPMQFFLHTGVQWTSTNALQPSPEQNELTSVQCCSAKQAHSLHCVTVVTAMQTCSSYRCAVNQHRCTAALPREKLSSPVFSAALQNRVTACTLSLCLHLCRFALHTGVQ